MIRRVLLVALAASAALPALGPAAPPITCGRITVDGTTYVVRSHNPPCSKAIRWSRAYLVSKTTPDGFRCRSYGESLPVHCVKRTRHTTYFFATVP